MSGPARRPARGSCWCALRSRRNLPGVQHPMQVRCRDLDVIVLVLARAAFRSEHATAVDIFEIPIGKFVVSLGLVRLFVVDTQIPLAVFGKAVEANEFIFLLCGRPVLAPCIALVEYKSSFVDEMFGMLVGSSVKRHSHGCSPTQVVRFAEGGSPETDRARGPAPWWRSIPGAFQSIAGFDRDEPIVDERQCRCVASRYIQDC